MAIKRTTYPHTGIYHRKITKIELRLNRESFADLTELLANGHQDDPLGLKTMESETIEFIKKYFKREMGGSNETFRRESIEWLMAEHVDQTREKLDTEFRGDPSTEQKRELTKKLGKTRTGGRGIRDSCSD
jgi:hypothetical protein